jgi:putative heme-binding domain-containing protein
VKKYMRKFTYIALTIAAGVLAFLALSRQGAAQQGAKVPDPDPEIERKSLIMAEGFEVNLFAADPLLAKPIEINFDPQGRLWVACSEVYPQIKPGQIANDKILILEDTKGVGKADKVTVFADGLLIPTGVEPGDGGAYVADSTELVHFSDPGADGKARKRRVVLSGFGTEDTHHILHTIRWGHDGNLYFNQSVYIHSHIETPYGVRRLNAGGIWQFRPETMRLEVFARGWWNSWGHHQDRWGTTFATDGAGTEGINYVVPGASYPATPGAGRILNGLNPGSPKHCGLEIISGRHIPPEWVGSHITHDFRGHRVCRFIVTEDGSGFAARERPELIKSNHPAFRPIDVKMGPDGAIYIADWYNPIIQHGEVDFRDPRRDVTHGRIWRVTAKGRPLVDRPQLVGATTEALLDSLKLPEEYTRRQVKRVLKERGEKVLPALAAWVKALDPKDADYEHHLLEALWTYQSLDVPEPQLLTRLLTARDPHARAAAVRVAGAWQDRLAHPQELLADRVADDHPQVRLEAVRSLAKVPSPRSAEIALTALDRPVDKFLDYALWLTARDLEPQWLPALQEGKLTFSNNVRHLTFALQASGSKAALKPLLDLLKAGKVEGEREVNVLSLVAALGGPAELAMIFDRVMGRDVNAARKAVLLDALEQAARQRGVKPPPDTEALGAMLTTDSEAVRVTVARLIGLWKVEELRPKLADLAKGANTRDRTRQAALEGLVLLGGDASRQALDSLAGKESSVAVRSQAIIALASLDLDKAAGHFVELLLALPANGDPSDVFAAFVQQKNGAVVLAKTLADRKLPADIAKIGVRSVRATGRDFPTLIDALNKAGNLTTVKHTLTPQEMQEMVADVLKNGDPARGEVVYRRKDQSCVKCHAIAGAGGQVGPDLASIGASAQVDYIIESILLPNKVIKENYHSIIVTTKQGKIITGIKVRESKTELVLRDAEDREVVVPAQDIDERANGGSLMPEGLADPLTRNEMLDLCRFLVELGKVGPYSVGQARVVRRWQTLENTPEARTLLNRTRIGSTATNDPALTWTPAYSQVAGTLPLDGLPTLKFSSNAPPLSFVRCQLDVSTPGKAKLLLNSATGITAWLNAEPLEAADTMTLDLPSGVQTLTFAIDRTARKDALRITLEDVAGSPARVRVVGGK